jgi:hypothetical protein
MLRLSDGTCFRFATDATRSPAMWMLPAAPKSTRLSGGMPRRQIRRPVGVSHSWV